MNYDQYGQCWTTHDELFNMLYQNPDLPLDKFLVKDDLSPPTYNSSVDKLYAGFPLLKYMPEINVPIEEFDQLQQRHWYMPQDYKDLDIAKWALDQCKTQSELQRVGQELLLFQERDAFNLLRYLKYMIDTFRANSVVWGLGRGSSVASYVLYLIGVHKIDSLYYDLPIEEFLK
jgi:hypothetical protein